MRLYFSILVILASILSLSCERSVSSDNAKGLPPATETQSSKTKPPPAPRRVESLPGVDVSKLDAPAQEMWLSLMNDFLSPCGDPFSVAVCVAERRKCRSCVSASRYVARLVDEGYNREEIAELYKLRYDATTKVTLSDRGSPMRGAPMARVTIVEFSDFECPHCRAAAPMLKRLVDELRGKVRLVFKHYPLGSHLHSKEAAIAAVAADRQGKFWEMHDILFKNQRALAPAQISKYASELKLDLKKFKKDLKDPKVRAKVEADRAEGKKAGVQGTPAVFVNGRFYELPLDQLGAYVEEELDQ